ncbi:DUF6807 family protein [Brachybacterium sp. AOP42-E1-35]|uniref:DUF6807 family protein n=1 Tax=unclassified Brachybacterium TaxID=2623841 RepID=UPI00402AFDFD
MARSSGGPTITQVAEAAGVSRATVSRVLNGRTTVDPGIGARVREAADRLQYRPNLTARYLSTGRTMTVSLVIPDLGNPMFQSILRSLTRAAEADGYGVLVAEASTPEREAGIARDARRQCDAVVLVAPRMNELELEALVPQISPVVVLNRSLDDPRIASVGIDYASGMSQLVRHLESLGHRDLLYVSGPPRSAAHHERLAALNALADTSPSLSFRTILGGASMADGHRVAEHVLETGATAVLAFNDLVAFGLLARLNQFGVDVPGDLSVTGFDGIDLARFAVPSLTTVDQEELDTGAVAWSLLHRQLDPSSAPEPTENALLSPRLLLGDSTGRVPHSRMPSVHDAQSAGDDSVHEPFNGPLRWEQGEAEWSLRHGESLLVTADGGETMVPVHSPRPHLHPVRTLGGRSMTVVTPIDHRHHYGASLALPDVNGTTYWGGRTFVEGRGSTLLANHGTQRLHEAEPSADGRTLRAQVDWLAHDGRALLTEQRTLAASLLPSGPGWGLRWRSSLTADAEPLQLHSPATRGRVGAGYGGLFWRLPGADETRILTADGPGEARAHGSTGEVLVVQRRHGQSWSSLVLVQDREAQGRIDPWFVRSSDYVGVGASLAWQEPRDVPLSETLEIALTLLFLDRAVDVEEVPQLLRLLDATPTAA